MNREPSSDDIVRELLPPRDPNGHKGSFGKVLLCAGSRDMAGAAILSATAVLRIGAGMVKLWSEECNRIILQTAIPESLLRSLPAAPETDVPAGFSKELLLDCAWADVIAAGCGIGKSRAAAWYLRFLLRYGLREEARTSPRIPYVLDADALNLFAADPALREELRRLCETTEVILTPHAGELERLSRSLRLPADGAALSSYFHCIVIAKGSTTSIYAPGRKPVFHSSAGNSGMATAGSGDVLTGTIAGLLAQGVDAWDAANHGVLLHALAGDCAAARLGEHAVLARDIADCLGQPLLR